VVALQGKPAGMHQLKWKLSLRVVEEVALVVKLAMKMN
jgi:hypothetical protein